MRRLLITIGLSAGCVTGCVGDQPRQARVGDGCFIGGCSAEVCSDRPHVITPCIWYDAYACFRGASCDLQPGGACGWTPTPELEACLASYPPAGSPER